MDKADYGSADKPDEQPQKQQRQRQQDKRHASDDEDIRKHRKAGERRGKAVYPQEACGYRQRQRHECRDEQQQDTYKSKRYCKYNIEYQQGNDRLADSLRILILILLFRLHYSHSGSLSFCLFFRLRLNRLVYICLLGLLSDSFLGRYFGRFLFLRLSRFLFLFGCRLGFCDKFIIADGEIGKERIRRAGEKIQEARLEAIALSKHEWDQTCYYVEHQKECDRLGHLPDEYFEKEHPPIDTGFRVLKLDDTNMKDVYYAPDDYDQGMIAALESNIKDDRTDLDLLFGCLIDWGLPLSLPYKSEQLGGCTVHTYNDGDLIACFDANIPESVVKEIAQRKPLRAVFRDSGFASSPEKINVFEIFKLYMPEDANDISKRVRVI